MKRQKCWRKDQMDGATLVFETREKLRDLVKNESRGWGDEANALELIACRLRIPFSYLWRLLYRKNEIKDVRGSVLLKLWIAHEALCEPQRKIVRKEISEASEATGRIGQTVTRAAAALAGEEIDRNA